MPEPMVIVDDFLNVREISGMDWKSVPLSPAGSTCSRSSCAAMYVVAFACPSLPASRPCIESSAKTYRRDMRSVAVMAAIVRVALRLSGNRLAGARCAKAASPATSAMASAARIETERRRCTVLLDACGGVGNEGGRKIDGARHVASRHD